MEPDRGPWVETLPLALRRNPPPLWVRALAERRKPLIKGGSGGIAAKRRIARELASSRCGPTVLAFLLGVPSWTFRDWLRYDAPRRRPDLCRAIGPREATG